MLSDEGRRAFEPSATESITRTRRTSDKLTFDLKLAPGRVGPCAQCRPPDLDHHGLIVTNEFDASETDTFDAAINDIAKANLPVILDLGGVTFFDSSALRSVLQARGRFARANGCVTFAAISRTTTRVSEIAGLAARLCTAADAQ